MANSGLACTDIGGEFGERAWPCEAVRLGQAVEYDAQKYCSGNRIYRRTAHMGQPRNEHERVAAIHVAVEVVHAPSTPGTVGRAHRRQRETAPMGAAGVQWVRRRP